MGISGSSEGIAEEVKKYVFYRDNWHCRNCNNSNGLDPHHVIFRSAGGKDRPNNLLTLCRQCHDDIHAGRIVLKVVEIKQYDLIVEFWRKPNGLTEL